jgi:hypothetical protein
MTRDDQQMLDTQLYYGTMLQEIKKDDPNILSCLVPGSRLYEKMNNPIIENIDEA